MKGIVTLSSERSECMITSRFAWIFLKCICTIFLQISMLLTSSILTSRLILLRVSFLNVCMGDIFVCRVSLREMAEGNARNWRGIPPHWNLVGRHVCKGRKLFKAKGNLIGRVIWNNQRRLRLQKFFSRMTHHQLSSRSSRWDLRSSCWETVVNF